ncbi:UNVERIFIED_CONTAM: TORTIFOLIA1-like protein 1 [Sesamum latifolium]|uniref:TORTIFOLIA1-like protein 1 n=1 Tax=Sesamum latifolium TaxID=2727402 RepID=A0AAW2WNR4_9LAMI
MDALHVGDMDSAFAEVLSTGDDLLLVKLMDKAGPVIDQLSDEVATEVLHAVSQLLMEQNFFEMCLYWVQQVASYGDLSDIVYCTQLADIVIENGPDVLGIPMEVKMEILENLHEAASSLELAEEWDGSPPEQLLLQLASAWDIDPQHLGK